MNRFDETDDQLPVSHTELPGRTTSQLDGDERHNNYRPLECVELDYTQLDLFVVDESANLPIGRPWLMLAICPFTKLVLHCRLSLPQREHTAEK